MITVHKCTERASAIVWTVAHLGLPEGFTTLSEYADYVDELMDDAGYEELFQNEDYLCVLEPRLEGDDCMGIIGSNPSQFNSKKAVLVSCDKDFKTIPDCDFLWCTTGNILTQDTETADYWHMFQTIKGDITDGYGGIPGWGDTAADFLADPFFTEPEVSILKSGKNKGQEVTKWVKRDRGDRDLWTCMVSIAAKAGMSESELIKQAQMARILRHTDYCLETKEITLWMP